MQIFTCFTCFRILGGNLRRYTPVFEVFGGIWDDLLIPFHSKNQNPRTPKSDRNGIIGIIGQTTNISRKTVPPAWGLGASDASDTATALQKERAAVGVKLSEIGQTINISL